MRAIFPYEEKESDLFPKIKRPIAQVYFWSKLINDWLGYKMVVDTGADYTILPRFSSVDLGINFKKDCLTRKTSGIGGVQTVYFLKRQVKVKIDNYEFSLPLGFINSDSIPPLLGREGCLNLFKVIFSNFTTEFSNIKITTPF